MIHYKIQDFLTGRYQRVAVNGENSNWEEVTSGIPYIYIGISTCPLIICSMHKWFARSCGFTEAYLFADDTKIFRIITGENDQNILQEDLRKMEEWSNNWLLKFHPEKCKYMNITRTANDHEGNREYQLLDQNIRLMRKRTLE